MAESEHLWLDDEDRYSRFRLIAWWDQRKLAAARVLVVGAGALGNEVLKNLALLGVGHLYVVDFDRIESSNLTRSVLFRARDRGRSKAEVAAESVRDMNPDVHVEAWQANIMTDVGLGVFRDVDVVIGCLDNREARLWVNRSCWKVGTPWIDGGIQEINGVVKVFTPPTSACYECAMTENDYRLINLRYSCPLLRQEDIQAGKVPTAPTISSVIAGLQAQEALKLIHGMPVQAGGALVFNGISNQFYQTRFPFREDCLSHEQYGDVVGVPLSASRHSARDLFQAVRDATGQQGPYRLDLDRDLVVALVYPDGREQPVMKPLQKVSMSDAVTETGEMAKPRLVHEISEESPLADRRLDELGIPRYDLLRVSHAQGEGVYVLEADRDEVLRDRQA